jgi:choline kinase
MSCIHRRNGAPTLHGRTALRALVLVAGVGRRLHPETARTPKCLVEVGGEPLLRGLLASLTRVGVDEVVLVAGYRQEQVRRAVESWEAVPERVTWVENRDFATTNTLHSVALAAPHVHGAGFLIVNGDLWVHTSELARLVGGEHRTAMLIDASIELDEEAMKVAFDDGGRIRSVSKQLPIPASGGESIGAYRFCPDVGETFLAEVASRAAGDGRTTFYESALDALLIRGVRAERIDVTPGSWVEVDDLSDLARARAHASHDAARAAPEASVPARRLVAS